MRYAGTSFLIFLSMSIQQTFDDALLNRDWAAADEALAQGADINHRRGVRLVTPIYAAMEKQDMEAIQWLKERGADINLPDARGDSILMGIIQRNDSFLFNTVIDWGLDLSAPNQDGVTPVLQAALFKHGTAYMRELLRRGADASHRSSSGTNALLVAAGSNLFEMVQMLLEVGADPLAINHQGHNLIHAAVHSKNAKLLKLVLDHTEQVRAEGKLNINYSSHGNSKPIALAAATLEPTMVVLLMRAGADLNARDANLFGTGVPPLSVLAMVDDDGEASLVKEALALGANPRLRDYQGNNAFYWAINGGLDGKREVLQALIDAGLDPATPLDTQGLSPLHAVWGYQQPIGENGEEMGPTPRQVIRAMIDMGFPTFPERWEDKSVATHLGEKMTLPPPLALALLTQKMDFAEELLEGGTPLNTLNNEGLSVLHYMGHVKGSSMQDLEAMAQAKKIVGIVTRQEQQEQAKKAQDEEGLFASSGVPAEEGAQKKKKKQQDLAEVRQEFQRRLEEMEAAGRAIVAQAAQWLSDHGANWDLRGRAGVTPLMNIAESNGVLLLGQLVNFHGAELLAQDDEGFGVADYAWKGNADETVAAILGHCARQNDWAPVQALMYNAILSSPEVSSEDPSSFVERSRFLQRLRLLPTRPDLLEFRDQDGNTPLIVAAATKQDDVAQLLLAMGADVHASNHMGETALHHAVGQGEADLIRQLRWAGANPEATTRTGVSAAELAKNGHVRVKEAMISDELIEVPSLTDISLAVMEAREHAQGAWERLAPLRPAAPAMRRRLFH
jgi:hypothetical protein